MTTTDCGIFIENLLYTAAKIEGGGLPRPFSCKFFHGLLPFSWVAGLFVPFFIGSAKNENGGALSKKAKGWAIAGLAGFAFWTVAIVGLLVGLDAF